MPLRPAYPETLAGSWPRPQRSRPARALDGYEAERPAAERVIMDSRAQLVLLFRPGPEVTALRELFSELVTDPDTVRRLSDLVSGAGNRYSAGRPRQIYLSASLRPPRVQPHPCTDS